MEKPISTKKDLLQFSTSNKTGNMFFLSNIGGVVTVLKNIPGKKNDSFKKKKKGKKKKGNIQIKRAYLTYKLRFYIFQL